MNIYKKIITSVAILCCGLYALFKWPFIQQRTCSEISDTLVLHETQENFLRGLPNFNSAKNTLGTIYPKLTWGKIERGNSYGDKTISIPFIALGPKGTMKFFGIYVCSTGKIEYSIDND